MGHLGLQRLFNALAIDLAASTRSSKACANTIKSQTNKHKYITLQEKDLNLLPMVSVGIKDTINGDAFCLLLLQPQDLQIAEFL